MWAGILVSVAFEKHHHLDLAATFEDTYSNPKHICHTSTVIPLVFWPRPYPVPKLCPSYMELARHGNTIFSCRTKPLNSLDQRTMFVRLGNSRVLSVLNAKTRKALLSIKAANSNLDRQLQKSSIPNPSLINNPNQYLNASTVWRETLNPLTLP